MTVMAHVELSRTFNLDPAAVMFLSAMYYRQTQNECKPITLTQAHIENLTGVGIYSQRRIRKTLISKGLLAEKREVKYDHEQEGYRTKTMLRTLLTSDSPVATKPLICVHDFFVVQG